MLLQCITRAYLPLESRHDSIKGHRLDPLYFPISVFTLSPRAPFFLSFQTLNWALQICGVSPEDAGRYECQATTHPPQNIVVKLRVVGKW